VLGILNGEDHSGSVTNLHSTYSRAATCSYTAKTRLLF